MGFAMFGCRSLGSLEDSLKMLYVHGYDMIHISIWGIYDPHGICHKEVALDEGDIYVHCSMPL